VRAAAISAPAIHRQRVNSVSKPRRSGRDGEQDPIRAYHRRAACRHSRPRPSTTAAAVIIIAAALLGRSAAVLLRALCGVDLDRSQFLGRDGDFFVLAARRRRHITLRLSRQQNREHQE